MAGFAEPEQHLVGIAWYRADQWQRLLDVSADREDIEDTFHEWLSMVMAKLAEMERAGIIFEKVEVDIDELVAWCETRGVPTDARARAEFVVDRMRERYDDS